MNIKRFITNKYTLSVIILACCLLTDIFLHKGMSRVILADSFTGKRKPQNLPVCSQLLLQKSKRWIQGVNTVEKINALPVGTDGFEMDVYFDTAKKHFESYHDSSGPTRVVVDSILNNYKNKGFTASIWFDFKNLNSFNAALALQKFIELRGRFNLDHKIIIESPVAKNLRLFCDNGFYTSYYIPFFNPYLIGENALVGQIDSITTQIKSYPASAMSGYYFQYPVLKKYFPNYPVLTWTSKSNISLVANMFNIQLKNDPHVKIVLYPY